MAKREWAHSQLAVWGVWDHVVFMAQGSGSSVLPPGGVTRPGSILKSLPFLLVWPGSGSEDRLQEVGWRNLV